MFIILIVVGVWVPEAKSQQINIQHQPPTAVEGNTLDLSFQLPGINANAVNDAVLFYRYGGDISFRQSQVFIDQSTISATVEIENTSATSLEYYLRITLQNGTIITHPQNTPRDNPIEVTISREDRKKSANQKGEKAGISYNILSPEPGEQVALDDVLIGVALFYEEEPVDADSLELIFDGLNVSEQADITPFFISYVPNELTRGKHSVQLRLKNGKRNKTITEWNFKAISPGVISAKQLQETQPNRHNGQLQLAARNQRIGGNTNDALRGNLTMNGRMGDIRYRLRGLFTSQNDPRLQSQNRYSGMLEIGNWLEVQAGHIFPVMSDFTIAGRRMLGVNSSLHLLNESINLQFMYGQLNRSIENLYDTVEPNVNTISLEGDQTVRDTTFQLGFEPGGRGTFKRQIAGARLSFGTGKNIKWGLHGVSIEDDVSSLTIIDDFQDLKNSQPDLLNSLSSDALRRLEENPDLLDLDGSNPNPKGNFVAGSDFLLKLFNNRFQFNAEIGASLLNEDITGGPLDVERAEDLGINLDEGTADVLDRLSFLIVINEQMSSLPFKFKEQGDGGNREFEPFVPASIFAGESEASLRLANNDLSVTYRWIGPNYESLANTTIRQDLAGITITDRIRLFNNQLYLTVGFETLDDNVVDNLAATTTSNSYRTNISWFPQNSSLPRISGGFRLNSRDNDISMNNPFLNDELVTSGVRNVRRVNSDSLAILTDAKNTSTQQFNISVSQQFNLFGLSHDANINAMYLNTQDNAFAFGDTESLSLNFSIQNYFTGLPLRTNLGFNLNQSEAVSGLTDVDIWGVSGGAEYSLLQQKLTLSASVSFTSNSRQTTPLAIDENSNEGLGDNQLFLDDFFTPRQATNSNGDPIFDDNGNPVFVTSKSKSNLYYLQFSGSYRLNSNHQFVVDFNFNNVVNQLRRNLADDRVLQARYIYQF